MQFQVFSVPANGSAEVVLPMNQFLRGHRVLSVERKLIDDGKSSYWTFCVEYLEGQPFEGRPVGKVDYKEVLTPDQFERFARLRNLRKELADKEAVPPYAVFTNEQLAGMVRLEKPSLNTIEGIEGIGQAKISKYGAVFLAMLQGDSPQPENEKSGAPDGTNSAA